MVTTTRTLSLENRRAIVSGGASGIGLAAVNRLLGEGAQVAVADRCPLPLTHPNLTSMRVDVRRKEDIHELYCGAKGAVGVPNLIVASAGVGVHERLEEGDPEKWAEVVQTNLLGTLRLVRAFLPEMQGGDIVFISSVAAQRPYEYGGAYAASKAALSMAAETLRIELKGRVRTTVVSPGMVDTGFFENELGSSGTGARTGGDEAALSPEDVADAIVYAITRPTHLAVHELTLRPRAQRF